MYIYIRELVVVARQVKIKRSLLLDHLNIILILILSNSLVWPVPALTTNCSLRNSTLIYAFHVSLDTVISSLAH